jgi:hypothetical protein
MPDGRRFAFLMGAGASKGTGDVAPAAPPVGNRLFHELRSEFPDSWGTVGGSARDEFERNFEDGMALHWQNNTDMTRRMLTDMGLFFARFKPIKPGCYGELIQELRGQGLVERTGVATLNYECILELTANGLGLPIRYGGEPTGDALLVLKPHGSCNWIVEIGATFKDTTFSATHHYTYGFPISHISPADLAATYAGHTPSPFPPVMSLFAPTKHSPVEPEVIQARRAEWQEWAGSATHIIVIGAYPLLADSHVWGPILENEEAEVWYISGTESGGYDEFARRLGARLTILGPYFGGAVNDLSRRLATLAA